MDDKRPRGFPAGEEMKGFVQGARWNTSMIGSTRPILFAVDVFMRKNSAFSD
jgi:hypothetical protein